MSDFERASLEAATSFLQTVVLLDDRAAFVDPDGSGVDQGDSAGVVVEDLIDPDDTSKPPTSSPATAPAPEASAAPKKRAVLPGGGLDAGLITRGFASQGLVCAVLRPFPGDSIEKETLKAAERSDIVVLDWEMQDSGEKATQIIKHLNENDEKGGGRLRLIAIYTGHDPLNNVYQSLKKLPGFSNPPDMKDADLVLENAPQATRIVMFLKDKPSPIVANRSSVFRAEKHRIFLQAQDRQWTDPSNSSRERYQRWKPGLDL